jgi:formylglycine-generating enzyme required for sulfatase activity
LYDRLSQHFGRDHFFIDVDNIPLGHDFVEVIQNEVGSCEVLLAVIGRQWLISTDPQGHRCLDIPEDFVRLEILTALERRIQVIPVLVGGASMPRSTELPDVLQPLARRQALVVGDHFHPDVDRLIAALEPVLRTAPPSREQAAELSAASPVTPPHNTSPVTPSPDPPTVLEPSFTNSIGMEFMLIPAGTFLMGSPASDTKAHDAETPAHCVTISQPFYLGKYPVTQAQWEAVMRNNPSRFKGNPNHPIENVSWNDVQAFLRKLDEPEGGRDYRLPTEAQWEYACRAGKESPRYHREVNVIAWHEANSDRQPQPVGQKLPNAWGLYDMLGNVWEWCHDGRRDYKEGLKEDARNDPIGPTDAGADRVVRGGSWDSPIRYVRAAYRYRYRRGFRDGYLGFRCACSGRRR